MSWGRSPSLCVVGSRRGFATDVSDAAAGEIRSFLDETMDEAMTKNLEADRAIEGTCVMWLGAGKTRHERFCDQCTRYLRARCLEDIHTSWNARAATDQ